MKNIYQFSSEDDQTPEDDIDELFSHMEQFEPPTDFIQRVMDTVSQLPLPQYLQQVPQAGAEQQADLIVHHEHIRHA